MFAGDEPGPADKATIFGANHALDDAYMLGKCWIEEDPSWFVPAEWFWVIEATAPPDYALPLYSNNNIRASLLTLVEPTGA